MNDLLGNWYINEAQHLPIVIDTIRKKEDTIKAILESRCESLALATLKENLEKLSAETQNPELKSEIQKCLSKPDLELQEFEGGSFCTPRVGTRLVLDVDHVGLFVLGAEEAGRRSNDVEGGSFCTPRVGASFFHCK